MDSQITPTSKLVLADRPAATALFDEEQDFSFRFDGLSTLDPCGPLVGDWVGEHLAHAIAASPGNLLRLTQRVFFFYRKADSDGLYSALLDLFIALGGKGPRLRRRLLNGSKDRLLPEHYASLSCWLEEGKPIEEKDRPPPGHSILSRGITGERELVTVAYSEPEGLRDPLVEAREHIEYFQIEEARDLLETAVFAQPEREDLHEELIHLYLATRDLARLQAMREHLSQIMTELPTCWRALDEQPLGGDQP